MSMSEASAAKKAKWPDFVPHPAAIASAACLMLLAGVLFWCARWIVDAAESAGDYSHRLGIALFTAAILSPIGVVAFAHHGFGRALDRWLGRAAQARGALPGVLSLWAGLYGWFVLLFASFLSLAGAMIISPSEWSFESWARAMERIFSDASPTASLRAIFSLPGLLWFAIAAYMFQLARVVEARLGRD